MENKNIEYSFIDFDNFDFNSFDLKGFKKIKEQNVDNSDDNVKVANIEILQESIFLKALKNIDLKKNKDNENLIEKLTELDVYFEKIIFFKKYSIY